MARTILVINDNAEDGAELRDILKEDYTVIEAESEEEMISVLRTGSDSISAILIDLFMRETNGFNMLAKISEDSVYSHVPVIGSAAQNDEETQARALSLGVSGFISKPYNRDILLHLLENTIRLREKSDHTGTVDMDILTGLLNRNAFFVQSADLIKAHEAGYYVLTCFDIENFKIINDQYGIETGDKILKQIAANIRSSMHAIGGICCHDAADKFGMLYPASCVNAVEIKQLHEVSMGAVFVGQKIKIRIGRYYVNDTTLPVSAMYDRATIAEESIKGRYDTYIAEYTEEMRQNLVNEQYVVNDMSRALEAGEFEPWFQPQYNHSTGALIGAEALVRWRKNGKIISPKDFIPIFERNGFIYAIDQYIWRRVCVLLRRWLDEGKKPLPVSVNISRFDLFQKDFIEKICALAEEFKLPADMLRLEVTESAFSEADDTIYAVVNELIKKGFTVEIDDFGSGYSSLNTLKDVPASILKLDMRFFEKTGDAKRGGNIIESVVRMAKWLDMAVIAEGVEDKAQADYLKSIGCFYIQGFYYAKPMPVEEYEAQLNIGAKEARLTRLQTIKTLDNNEFWDAKSIDTLIFNSYVGAACILEYNKGEVELLRATDYFVRVLCGDALNIKDLLAVNWSEHIDSRGREMFKSCVEESLKTREAVTGEYALHNLPGCPETVVLRCNMRVIATTGERCLIYCLNDNMTDQRTAENDALIASERVSAVMDSSHCGIAAAIVHENGTVERLFVNNRFYELLKYTRKQYEATVKSPFDRVLPEDRARVFDAVTKLSEIGSTVSMEMRIIRRDGSIFWVRCDISIVKFANIPQPVHMCSFLDITEQKENELKGLENARQLEFIMSNVNGGVSALQVFDDATSKRVFDNDKHYEIYGYTREEALAGKLDVMKLIFPADLPVVMEKINQLKKDRQPRLIDFRITKKDGSLAMLRANASLMSIPGYGDDIITSIVTDITEKKSLEETISAIVDNINGGISAIYLKNGKPVYALSNEQYYNIFGCTKEEFEAGEFSPFDLLHPEDRAWVEKKITEAQKYGERYTMEYRIVRKDGTERTILRNTSVYHMFGIDEPVQLSVSSDITEIREMQRKEIALSVQLQTIMQNISGGVTATLFNSNDSIEIVFSNSGFYEMYGYTKELMEAEVPNILDLIVPEDREKTMDTVARIVRERGSETYEYRCRKRDGGIIWVQCTNTVFSMDGIGDTVLLAVTTDVTELRVSQQEQIAVTDRLRAVMNAMSGGMTAVIFHEDSMEFLFANNRYYEIHGIHRGDIGESTLSNALNYVVPKYREMMRNIIHEAAKTRQTTSVEYQIQRPDGVIRWVRATISMTELSGIDDPVQVTVFTDITAEKEAADQLRFLNDIAHDILAQSDSEQAIRETLSKLMTYFSSDRGYVVELDESRRVSNNTYEVCADGVSLERERLQSLPYLESDYWYETLSKNEFLIVDDVNSMDGEQEELREMMHAQKISSIMLAPLRRAGRLIGFAGVDNPKQSLHQVEQLKALADYVTVLLTRRDLMRKIRHDSETVQQLMDDTPGGFLRVACTSDKKPTIESFNDGFCQMLHMTREEITENYGEDAFKCLFPENLISAKQESSAAFSAGGQFDTQCRLRQKGGKLLWVRLTARFVHDERGRQFLNAYFTDITETVEEEENQRSLLDNLPFGAAMYMFDGERLTVTHINRQYWKLVGRDATEYDKTSVFAAIHPDDRDMVIREVKAAAVQGRSAVVDIRIMCGNGDYAPFHVTASVVPLKNGRYQLFAAYLPISHEAISMQQMLPVALSTIMEISDEISYIKNKDLHYIACTQALADMIGAAGTRDIIGKNDYDLFDRKFAEKFTEDDRRIIETGKPLISFIEHIPTIGGGMCLARTSKYPIRDDSGDVIGVYCISHDVTIQRQRDSQLELLNRTIPGGLASFSISNEGLKTLYFSDGFFAYSGYTREEYTALTEKEPLALMFEEDRAKLRDMLHTFMAKRQDGMTGTCDYRCRTKDGQMRHMSLKCVLAQLDTDEFVLNTVQFDMTQHFEIEQRMENLLDNLPFGAAMYEYDGEQLKTLHVNHKFQLMAEKLGNPGTVYDYSPIEVIHPDDVSVVDNELKNAIANHRSGRCNIRVRCGENKYLRLHIDANIMEQTDGKYLVYVAYTRLSEQQLTFENALPHIFSTIMDSSTDLAFAKDINFRYICCSKTFAKLLGLKSEKDVVGKTDYELFPKHIADMFRQDDSALFASKNSQTDIQEMLPSPDGTEHYIRTSKYLLRDDTDEIIGIYCIGSDVTEVREAYARLRLLTNSIPGGIATFRYTNGNIETLYFNDGVCELAGYSREEFSANPIPLPDLIIERDRPIISKQIELMKKGDKNLNFTVRIHNKKGGNKWINSVATVTDQVGDVYNVSAVLTDVTAQQEEKEQLRISEEQNRIAIEHSGNVITHFKVADRTLTLPSNLSKIYELPAVLHNVPNEQISLGRISPDTVDAYKKMFDSIMAGSISGTAIFKQRSTRGWRWLKAQYTTVLSNTGEPVSAVISFSDISEQQEKEAVYRKWQQNLEDKGNASYTLYRCNLSQNSSYDSVEGGLINIHERWSDSEQKNFNERTLDFAEGCVVAEDRERYLRFINSDAMLAGYYRGNRSSSIEFRGRIATGEIRWIRLNVELVEYPHTKDIAAYLMYEDIHDWKLRAIQTKTMAETDPLTGLLNRNTFIVHMNEMLSTRKGNLLYALLLLDVDGFKLINDSFGHATGDQILIDAARAIKSVLRDSDLVCRMGGDEFLVCLSAVPDKNVIMSKAKQIRDLMHTVFGADVQLSVSAGIAVCPEDGATFETLYPKADRALYHIKGHGKDNCICYDESMKTELTSTSEHLLTPIDPAEKPTMLIVSDCKSDLEHLTDVFDADFSVETVGDVFSALNYLHLNVNKTSIILFDLSTPDMDGVTALEYMQRTESFANIPVVAIGKADERDALLRAIKAGASEFVTRPIDQTLLRIRVESAISKAENVRLRAQNRFLSFLKSRENQ